MLSTQGLILTFNLGMPTETRALRGLSLDTPAGQFVAVIGSNGAGKSTSLNSISGDQLVDFGSITIDGVDVTRKTVWQRADKVARVLQDPMAGTCGNLAIEENTSLVMCRGQRRGFSFATNRKRRKIFREQLRRLGLGLENRLTDRIGLFSNGQRQVVSLLMASLQPSCILLSDEHTATLGLKVAAFVLEPTAKIVSESKLTAMIVTHSMRQALNYGDRTAVLHQGNVTLDVQGGEHHGLGVPHLLQKLEETRDAKVDDDALLLGWTNRYFSTRQRGGHLRVPAFFWGERTNVAFDARFTVARSEF